MYYLSSSFYLFNIYKTTGENGQRELSIDALNKVAKHFAMTLDEMVNFKGKLTTEEKIQDKNSLEQLKIINELDTDDGINDIPSH